MKERPEEENYSYVYARHIDEVIEQLNKQIEEFKERSYEYSLNYEINHDIYEYYHKYTYELIDKRMNFEDAKKRGLNCVIEMDFGDNHGNIQGDRIGYAMDYEGRYIRINQDDLMVLTEQNR